MPGTKHRRHAALGRRAASVSRVARARAKATGKTVRATQHDVTLIERELVELDEECARFRRLHRRLADARRAGRDLEDILAELGPSVFHLHVHTRGLHRLVDALG